MPAQPWMRSSSGCSVAESRNRLPAEFPHDSSVIGPILRWIRLGLFDHLWAALLTDDADLGGVNREWQAADAAMSKARLGGPSGGIPPTGAKRV